MSPNAAKVFWKEEWIGYIPGISASPTATAKLHKIRSRWRS
jgi:hypothetical protein